jgi:hypothetical protein
MLNSRPFKGTVAPVEIGSIKSFLSQGNRRLIGTRYAHVSDMTVPIITVYEEEDILCTNSIQY